MIGLLLRNREEVVFSASPATEGGHGGLAFIPGAALWGALAGRIYSGSLREQSFDLVHSGKLRVSPAFPLTHTRAMAFPLPQSMRGPKHESDKGYEVKDGSVRRYADLTPAMRGFDQPQSGTVALDVPKGWFIAADGSMVRPGTGERGKAATMPGERRVAQGQFFQYEHLNAGQEWIAWIDADDPAVERTVAGQFAAKSLTLGRSKRREFGGVFDISVAESWRDPRQAQFEGTAGEELVLWCISDVALLDRFGSPDLAPDPESFGIAGFDGELDASRSVINARRYSPYNMHLRANDREHAVISAGSVLVYRRLKQPVARAAFAGGVGMWRERGFGLVWVDPPLLLATTPYSARTSDPARSGYLGGRPRVADVSPDAQATLPGDQQRALDAIKTYADERQNARQIADEAAEIREQLERALSTAVLNDAETPNPAQWSQLSDRARASRNVRELDDALFRNTGPLGDRGCCVGAANNNWDAIRPRLQRMISQRGPATGDLQELVFVRAIARAARSLAREWKPSRRRT